MAVGFTGFVMKNNVKVSEFPCTVTTLEDGTQRITYDAYDFAGIKGFRRRDWKRLGLTKKKFPVVRIFRYDEDWDTLSDRGCISYWDQTSQAQIPLYALRNKKAYEKVAEKQRRANAVLYYCLQADTLIKELSAPKQKTSLWDIVLPSILVGGIILTSVMNIYAASQYLQAYGIIHGTTGALSTLQNYFMHIAGLPNST
jgi:hypothetical protein